MQQFRKYNVLKISMMVSAVMSCMTTVHAQKKMDPLAYITPEIGGVGQLLVPTRPTMQQPYQMMRMTPSRRDYLDDQISSFPLLLVSHRLGEVFSILPSEDATITENSWRNKLSYDQQTEIRDPWHYQTYDAEKDLFVEFTPGKKTGTFRFKFPKDKPKNLLFGTYNGMDALWHFQDAQTISGWQYFPAEDGLQPVKVFLYGRFNQPAANYSLTGNKTIDQDSVVGSNVKVYSSFTSTDTIVLQYAVSFVSEAQAKENFANEFSKGWTFQKNVSAARKAWETVIGQIEVEGGTEGQKKSFYTSLYRCYERMVDISENGKYYSGYDNKIHTDNRPFYVDDWVWDTYLALHPLRTILQPEIEQDMLQSYVRMYEQSGWMPTFPVVYGDHACMNGFHSSVIMLDAYNKGLRHFDVMSAYKGMKKNSLEATMLPWRNGPATALDQFYYKNGYFPALHPGEKETHKEVHGFEKRQAVAITLGTSYDDWATGEMAKALHLYQDTATLFAKSKNYRHLWNADKKFFLPKDSLGQWIEIDPKWDGGDGGRDYYDENNGWTYKWQVQQDIPDLVRLLGGKQELNKQLDQLFREDLGREKKHFWVKFTDATGLVGQYSMGNEPSFHIPYLYNYSDAPWKTQERVRLLLDTWFSDNIFGIPGDEDGGGMSAFVVFSAMGFYPITPGKPVYTIGSPLFNKISIRLNNGKTFTIIAKENSKRNKYVQKAILNGQELPTPFFTHQQLVNGGTLQFIMGDRPNKNWGK